MIYIIHYLAIFIYYTSKFNVNSKIIDQNVRKPPIRLNSNNEIKQVSYYIWKFEDTVNMKEYTKNYQR